MRHPPFFFAVSRYKKQLQRRVEWREKKQFCSLSLSLSQSQSVRELFLSEDVIFFILVVMMGGWNEEKLHFYLAFFCFCVAQRNVVKMDWTTTTTTPKKICSCWHSRSKFAINFIQ